MEEQSIITSLAWILKGYAANVPKHFTMEEDEWADIKNDPEVQEEMKMDMEDDEFDLAGYDDEDDTPNFVQETKGILQKQKTRDAYPMFVDEESDEDKDDYNIRDSDALIIAGKIEKHEFSTLEVYIYEEKKNNLYVHHDITLSAFPLCLEWLCINPTGIEATSTKRGNFAVVGTFLPEIEIWDLDVLDAIEPTITLGGEIAGKKKGPKKLHSKGKAMKNDSHVDSVISMSLNLFRKEILATGSADTTIKLWDISKNACVSTFTDNKEKIQNVKWSLKEEAVLASGCFDRTLKIFDVRQHDQAFSGKAEKDIECLTWDPNSACNIVIGMEDGAIKGLDARKLDKPLFYFRAHSKSTTAVMISPKIEGLMATASHDGYVRLWDLNSINDGQLNRVAEKHMKAGRLNCGAFYEDQPWTLACGNNEGELVIWDTSENQAVADHFSGKSESGKLNVE